MKPKRIVILGATSGIAEACARLWAEREPVELILVGRNLEKIEHVAQDLRVRSPESSVLCMACDFLNQSQMGNTVQQIGESGNIDVALIAFGVLSDQQRCQSDMDYCHEQITINGVSAVACAEAFAAHLDKQGFGSLVVISSVAGDRGRKSNYTYGAAKGMVSRYMQGLQHRFANSAVKAILVKPGPTDTPMTAQLKSQGASLASVETVANDIVRAVDGGKTLVYTPTRWKYIMAVICHIPSFIFNRLDL